MHFLATLLVLVFVAVRLLLYLLLSSLLCIADFVLFHFILNLLFCTLALRREGVVGGCGDEVFIVRCAVRMFRFVRMCFCPFLLLLRDDVAVAAVALGRTCSEKLSNILLM